MDLKNILLSERKINQKSAFFMVPFIGNSRTEGTNLWGMGEESDE